MTGGAGANEVVAAVHAAPLRVSGVPMITKSDLRLLALSQKRLLHLDGRDNTA